MGLGYASTQLTLCKLGRHPLMRQKVTDFTRPLRRQAREDVLQISIRIMPVEPRRLDQTHDRRRAFTAAQ